MATAVIIRLPNSEQHKEETEKQMERKTAFEVCMSKEQLFL